MDFHETTKEDGLPALQNQFLDLNRYTSEELSISWSGTPNDEENCLKPLFHCLEHCIISLER